MVDFYAIIKLIYNYCPGLSLKTQELTALFLFLRLLSSISWESKIHLVLDFISLLATAWVVYMIRFKLKSTYIKDFDKSPILYLVILRKKKSILKILIGFNEKF
jgi:ER lumen protein retaining receptor